MTVESTLADRCVVPVAASVLLSLAPPLAAQPLASWNDGPAKAAIVRFVTDVTTRGTEQWWGDGIAVQGGYAYLPCNADGLEIIDISDPTQPRRVSGIRRAMPSGSISPAVMPTSSISRAGKMVFRWVVAWWLST